MKRIYAGVFAVVGWFALIGNYFAYGEPSVDRTIHFFSHFTILSSILVAAILTATAFAANSDFGRFLRHPAVAMAAATYVTVTITTYHFLLAALYDLAGWRLVTDRMLHYLMPPVFLLFWLVFVPRGVLRLRHVGWMLVPPLVFAAYTFVRGAFTGFYPYFFINVSELGVAVTARNVVGFIVFFGGIGLVYLLVDRLVGRLLGRPAPA